MKFVWTVLMVVVVIVSAWTFLAAQSAPVAAPVVAAPAVATPAAIPTRGFAPAERFDRDAERPTTALQRRYLELSTEKARLMTEDQLRQAIGEMNREVEELHAWAKVEESIRHLQQVIESHPQSKAADAARAALKAIQDSRSSNAPDPAAPNPGPPNSGPLGSKRSSLNQERLEKPVTG